MHQQTLPSRFLISHQELCLRLAGVEGDLEAERERNEEVVLAMEEQQDMIQAR